MIRLRTVHYFVGGFKYAYDGYGRKVLREETKPGNGKAKGKEQTSSPSSRLRTESTAYLYDGLSLLKDTQEKAAPSPNTNWDQTASWPGRCSATTAEGTWQTGTEDAAAGHTTAKAMPL